MEKEQSCESLPSPLEIKKHFPLSKDIQEHVIKNRERIKRILNFEEEGFLIITGPCSIDDYTAALDYAKRLRALQEKLDKTLLLIMRVYFEKPRTKTGWKGFLYDPNKNNSSDLLKGISLSRKLLLEINSLKIPCATEFLSNLAYPYFEDLISWAAIGARTVESQLHREFVSSLDIAVGFKNSTDGNIEAAINAIISASNPHTFLSINSNGNICKKQSLGNPHTHLILRGGKKPNYDESSIKNAIALLKKENLKKAIIVDCSHGNSNKDPLKQPDVALSVISQLKNNPFIKGIMLESYLKEGNQPLEGKEYGKSKTDKCMSWHTTERLILDIKERLS